MDNVLIKGALTVMIGDGPDFARANDLAALRREDLVQAKEAKANVKRVTKENPKATNARTATGCERSIAIPFARRTPLF